ncbi:MAG: D-alanyl-D-alanine carboxypeptidase/D-alanyl-D-alanine-endopeptidase [Phycisphaerales bacterium]|nr:D-alanyl-D-alanine carboxypeptidase/D-alanyl-D-alanine-endopeptidase [Phycisphaerales bacterium]
MNVVSTNLNRGACAAAACVGLFVCTTLYATDLASTVKGLVNISSLQKGKTAVSIRGDNAIELVRIHGDTAMSPASNEKLLTTGSALRLFGPDFVFQTRLLRDGNRLIAVGDGDPAFADPELLSQMVYTDKNGTQQKGKTPEDLLDLWVQGAKASGMTQCDELVIDDRVFDRMDVHPSWPADQLNEPYCAPVGGITFHLNRLDLWAKPSDQGAEIFKMRPGNDFVKIVNQTQKLKGKDNGLWIQREESPNTFTIHGECKKTLEEPVSIALTKPSSFFAQILTERLVKGGIPVKSVRLASATDPVSEGEPVGPLIRTPIITVLTRCNVDSQNLYAECLLKRIGFISTGTSGSWLNGSDAIEKTVRSRIGDKANLDALDTVDGSGLSKENRVSASILSAWLNDLVSDEKIGETFTATLAVGGQSGTVKKRFQDLDAHKFSVHCKTGYINGVCALSGVVKCVNGHYATFSVIYNGFEAGGIGKAKQLQESIVKATAQYLETLQPVGAVISPKAGQPARESLGGGS